MCKKLNCWEFTNCGREPGGIFAETEGVCPVSTAMQFDGTNDGRAGGRICWQLHHGNHLPQPSRHLPLIVTCYECAFYRRVKFEESIESTEPTVALPLSITHD